MSRYNRTPGTAITLAVPEPNLAVIPEQVSQHGLSVTQFAAILLAYWKQTLAITLLVAALGYLVIKYYLPKTYTATVTLIVNSDVKDPLAGAFPAEMIGNYVSTQIELLSSPMVLVPVAQRLGLMEDKEFNAGFSGSQEALREVVQRNLAAAIATQRGVGGQLLYVSASAKTADKAAIIANAVADVYIEQDRRRLNDPASQRAQRYAEELAELREKVNIAQDKVTAFSKENGLGDLSAGAAGTAIQSLDSLHQRLLETQNTRRSLEAKLTGRAPDESFAGSAALDAQLAQLAQLSSTYGPQHPKVRELNAQIAMTRQSLANANRGASANTEDELAQTRELERKYAQAVAEQEAKVAKVRQGQDEGSKLLLELDSAKSVYKQALDGFDQIMFQAVANHTNVSVVSLAIPPLRASKPNKPKLMLGLLAAALAIGVGVPLLYGLFFARRLRCRDDVERDLGIAVLAQLEVVPALVPAS